MPELRSSPAVSIVVALKDADENLQDILDALSPQLATDVELLIVAAGDSASVAQRADPNVRILRAPDRALVPHLWRDGIRQSRGVAVALTTAHCVPCVGWVEQLRRSDLRAYAGVGGVIDLGEEPTSVQAAIYLLRYSAFASPQPARELADIAADNAVYEREAILRHADLLEAGFWEPSFHRRFAHEGRTLRLNPDLRVEYRGREAPGTFLRHRWSHGLEYGRSRAAPLPWPRRLGLLAASPLVPVVLLARILRRGREKSHLGRVTPRALPWLLAFILAWSGGEALGYIQALGRGNR